MGKKKKEAAALNGEITVEEVLKLFPGFAREDILSALLLVLVDEVAAGFMEHKEDPFSREFLAALEQNTRTLDSVLEKEFGDVLGPEGRCIDSLAVSLAVIRIAARMLIQVHAVRKGAQLLARERHKRLTEAFIRLAALFEVHAEKCERCAPWSRFLNSKGIKPRTPGCERGARMAEDLRVGTSELEALEVVIVAA